MSGHGRPLRFLGLFGTAWIGMRVALLWSATGSLPEAIRQTVSFAAPAARAPVAMLARPLGSPPRASHQAAPAVPAVPVQPAAVLAHPARDPVRVQFALLGLVQFGAAEAVAPQNAGWQTVPSPVPGWPALQRARAAASRWSGSAWFVVRPGTGIGVAPGAGQLGGSQAGVRLAYALTEDGRFAIAGRLTAPLRGQGREAALGLEWRPLGKVPVRVMAGGRIGLDGTHGGPELGLIAGLDQRVGGFRLEAYGQAGAIARARIEPYADGAARLSRPVAQHAGRRLELGVGAWGAAQRDGARFDLGPSLGVALPVARQALRVSLDWRQRVAGDARPGSGPALTLGADF